MAYSSGPMMGAQMQPVQYMQQQPMMMEQPIQYMQQPMMMEQPVQYMSQPPVQYQQQAAPAPLPTLMSLDEMNAPPGYKFAGYAPAPEVGESNPGWSYENGKWLFTGVQAAPAPAPIQYAPQPVQQQPMMMMEQPVQYMQQQPVQYMQQQPMQYMQSMPMSYAPQQQMYYQQ